MSDYAPVYSGGVQPHTYTTSGAVTGGTFAAESANGTIATAGVGAVTIGVFAQDCASGGRVAVWPLTNVEHEITVVAAATITAGDAVVSAAGGLANTAVPATAAAAGTLLGIALTTATAGNKVRFLGRG